MFAAAMMVLVVVASAEEPGSWLSRSGHFRVSYESDLQPIIINRMHRWVLSVVDMDGAPVTGAALTVTGGMPAHDHGLPTSPRVTGELAPGRYLLEGLRFHMSGEWQIEIAIEVGELSDVVVISLRI
jgi:hypothetical protein